MALDAWAAAAAAVEALIDALDFTKNDLGKDVAAALSLSVKLQCAQELDPDGDRWPELSPAYEAWKDGHHPGPMGVLFGDMLTPGNLAGKPTVTPDKVVVEFGDGTNDAEAAWFEDGDPARNRPPRRFWYINELGSDLVTERIGRGVDAAING